MKKILCIFLSITMLVLFTSCAGDKNDTDTTADTSVSQENTEETKSDKKDENKKDGLLSSFTATTLDGEKVNESIFEGKKVTMVNIWATFCSPCIGEMPDLQKLHEDYADKGFQIVGIVCDIYENKDGTFNEKNVTEAKSILKDTGVEYLNLLPSADLKKAKLDSVTAVPETFFVDENGNIIGQSYVGSRSYEQWAEIIEEVLGE